MSAPEVIMYATGFCPYCTFARRLLRKKGVEFAEIRIDHEPERRAEMEARSGRYTVPQIFIGEHHVGGYDDMAALDRAGELDPLLGRG
jgi:glutaredoxin 3